MSDVPESREIACGTIATMATGGQAQAKDLLRKPILDQLKVCLFDPTESIQLTAAGAVRNLAALNEGAEHLAKTDMPAGAVLLLERVAGLWQAGDRSDRVLTVAVCMLSALTCFCEVSQGATKLLLSSSVVLDWLAACLVEATPSSVLVEMCKLLLVGLDRHAKFGQRLCMIQGFRESMVALCSAEAAHVAALACSIVVELASLTDETEAALAHVMPLLTSRFLAFAPMQLFVEHPDCLNRDEETGESAHRAAWRESMICLQLALELISNASSVDEAADDWTALGDDEAVIADGGDQLDAYGGLSEARVAVLQPAMLVQTIAAMCVPLPQVVQQLAQTDSDVRELLVTYYSTMTRALGALGNCVLCSSVDHVASELGPIWNLLISLVDACMPLEPVLAVDGAPSMLEALAQCMAAVVRKALALGPEACIVPSPETVQMLIDLARSGANDNGRAMLVVVLTQLGMQPASQPHLPALGELLVALLDDRSLAVSVEAVNGILDIFAETDHNDIVHATGMMPLLEAKIKPMRALLRSAQAAAIEETLLARLDETVLNLKNFLVYKSNQ